MHTPSSRHASRGLRPQVSPMNIPVLLAPTKEIQRPGSTPPLRSRASSSTGSRPHFTVFFDQTEPIAVLPLFPLDPQSLSPIQSVQSNQSIQSADQSIQSGSVRSVHQSIQSVDQSIQSGLVRSIQSVDHSIQSGSVRSVQSVSNPINQSNPPIYPSAQSSPPAHCHLPVLKTVAKQTF